MPRRIRANASPAMVLACIAVVLAMAGSAFAARSLITGADIKDGSISRADLSRSVVKSLKGKRGPAGPAGRDGSEGPQGSAGPAGPQGAAGARGATGAPGPQGEQGEQGPPGSDGAPGQVVVDARSAGPANAGAALPLSSDGPTGGDGVDVSDGGSMLMAGQQYKVDVFVSFVSTSDPGTEYGVGRLFLGATPLDGNSTGTGAVSIGDTTLVTPDVPDDLHTPAQAAGSWIVLAGSENELLTLRGALRAGDPSTTRANVTGHLVVTRIDSTIGIATALAGLTTLDAFGTAQSPLSSGGRWSRLAWAANIGQVAGSGTTGGWTPSNGYPVVSGAYWNPASFADAGRGVAVAGTLSAAPDLPGRSFSAWLDMAQPGSARSGYELRFTYAAEEEGENLYDVTLSKWVSGARTVLASLNDYTFRAQSSFALADKGGTVHAWVDAGSGYRQLLSASDATFGRGYVGIEGVGNMTRVRQFRAGVL